MQATGGTRDGARGMKRAVKVEEEISPAPVKRPRQSTSRTQTSHKPLELEEFESSPPNYRILSQTQREQQPISVFSATTSTACSSTSSSLATNITGNSAQFTASAPSAITGPPPYAYFTWNSQALPVHASTPTSRLREKEKTDLETEIQKEMHRRASFASTSTSVPSPSTQTTNSSVGFPLMTAFAPISGMIQGQSSAHSLMTSQVSGKTLPSFALHQRLEGQLEVRHTTLLAHINARYTYILEDDRRRRAAYQEAALQRAMEIDAEERWGRELSHLLGLTSPVLSSSPSPSLHPQHTYSPPLVEIQRNRAYLQLLITNTDMHISALRDAHRVAYEREVIEAQLAARVLRELEVRRDTLVLRRAQETRCAAGELPAAELAPSLATMKCIKLDCLGCAKEGCVSVAVAAVRERVEEVARRVGALNRA